MRSISLFFLYILPTIRKRREGVRQQRHRRHLFCRSVHNQTKQKRGAPKKQKPKTGGRLRFQCVWVSSLPRTQWQARNGGKTYPSTHAHTPRITHALPTYTHPALPTHYPRITHAHTPRITHGTGEKEQCHQQMPQCDAKNQGQAG